MHGVFPVDKPKGMTSHDVIYKMRRVLGTKKVGHTGTLDPEVTGVLPIVVGDATKLTEILQERDKRYSATVTLGVSTDTEDASCQVIASQSVPKTLTKEDVKKALEHFIGNYDQMVPLYSSVKVNGRKLYWYAREGEAVERPIKSVYISSLNLVSDLNYHDDCLSFDIDVTCSKGTYIRTLAYDIGKFLGYPAHMSYLRRTGSCGFTIEQAVPLEDIQKSEEELQLIPIIDMLDEFTRMDLSHDESLKYKVMTGQKLQKNDILKKLALSELDIVFFTDGDMPLALYKTHSEKLEQLKPYKMFSNLWGTYGNI